MDANERLYQAYRRDRDDGMSHAQIVLDGVYGEQVEAFAMRYSLTQSAYADAMRKQDQQRRLEGGPEPAPRESRVDPWGFPR